MDSEFREMRSLPALSGSLNAIVSELHRQKRPLSLSESFAYSPLNLERAASANNLTLLVEDVSPRETQETREAQETPPPVCCSESELVTLLLRFLFHITLISIFETVFFFIYVSTLEDNGILKTVHDMTGGFVESCSNLTPVEQALANDLLSPFLNVTQIDAAATAIYTTRTRYNAGLFQHAWIYVGGIAAVFLGTVVFSRYRKIVVAWRPLLLENIGLVTMLALYEYMFFTTIIFPYSAISGQEIEQQLVSELQNQCGLLLDQR
jgi:hypothetical protein